VGHAAVVARGWGIPAVVGAHGVTWHPDRLIADGRELHAGDVITIDSTTEQVWVARGRSARLRG
jgi:pyruvate,orthophosphate dikinase